MLRTRTQFTDSVRRLFSLRCRFPQVVLLACFVAMAGIAGRARAEDDILRLVPQQALGFVVVNRPAAADAKLQQLGQQMKLPIPSLLAKLQGPDGIREGLDKNRPIALLALPPKNDNGIPSMIGVDPRERLRQVPRAIQVRRHEGRRDRNPVFGLPGGGPQASAATPRLPRRSSARPWRKT